jgi:hypothetical protein
MQIPANQSAEPVPFAVAGNSDRLDPARLRNTTGMNAGVANLGEIQAVRPQHVVKAGESRVRCLNRDGELG